MSQVLTDAELRATIREIYGSDPFPGDMLIGRKIEAAVLAKVQPRKRTEQDAWEDWAAKVRPAGDVDEVQRRWLASAERRDFMDEDAPQEGPSREEKL